MDDPRKAGLEEKPILTSLEVCEMLQISKPTLLQLVHRQIDPLPVWKNGRVFRFSRNQVLSWMEDQAIT